jgi:hypothetical protein
VTRTAYGPTTTQPVSGAGIFARQPACGLGRAETESAGRAPAPPSTKKAPATPKTRCSLPEQSRATPISGGVTEISAAPIPAIKNKQIQYRITASPK